MSNTIETTAAAKTQGKDSQRRAAQVQSGAARAAMLGASDGLVTNVALILGVAGASANADVVRIAGIASLVAGAFSMAIGEYISMQAQKELLESILVMEREELKNNPKETQAALAEILEEHGVAAEHAREAAKDLARDPEKAMRVYAQDRLGINADELGSPYSAAFSSLATFAGGALIPLLPWFFLKGAMAVWTSLALAAIAAVAIGSYLAYMSDAKWYRVATRQLVLLALAAGATYLIGVLFHVSLA
jgi:VIT1/CCC1 family predicted Fe2+/Mn2+ transporter